MSMSDIAGLVTSVATFLQNTFKRFGSLTTVSYSDVAKLTRVEPLTIISKDLVNLEYMPDISNSVLNIFCGYYLQAVNIFTGIDSVETVKNLDRLNPDRDGSGLMLQTSLESLSEDSYKYALPHVRVSTPGLEDDKAQDLKQLNDVVNLSVGKMLNVNFSEKATRLNEKTGNETTYDKISTIPVAVRLLSSVVPDSTIIQLLTGNGQDNSFTERWHAWRAGRISGIKDLIFAQDLIDEYKRATIADESGIIQEIVRRVNNSRKYGLLTENPSLASASNLFIISEDIARQAESKLGGRLSNPRVRDTMFTNTYAMIIAVVDRERERVVFYTRGIAASTDVSIREIKAANKGKGPDVGDLLKSMMNGMPASF